MKLENYFNDATFLAPKVYGGVYSTGEITKVKGFKNHVKYNQLKSLLKKGKSLILDQEKWFRSIEEANITIKNKIYTLLPTENKRQLIYKNNKLIATKPFTIDNKNIINN